MTNEFGGVGAGEQLSALASRALDDRPIIATGFPLLDAKLHRGGLQPGTLVILGGRMHTRKTTVAINVMLRMLRGGVPVGFATLDESLPMYVGKLMSAMSRCDPESIEEQWDSASMDEVKEAYASLAVNLSMTAGFRPTIADLTAWLEMSGVDYPRPRVVVLDYTALLAREQFVGKDRIPRLMENLQVWTDEQQLVTIALHQVGRQNELETAKRYHGDTPMSAESLRDGGEEQADIVLGTYRPALNQLGNLERKHAELILGDSFSEEKWLDAHERVRRYAKSTFLQLLKNRPSTKGLHNEGVELVSPDTSHYLEPAETEELAA